MSIKNVIGTTLAKTFIGSSNQQVFDEKGRLYQGGIPRFSTDGGNVLETLYASTGFVMTPSTMTSYGVSVIAPTSAIPSSGVGRVYLAAPKIGVSKTIILKSTAAGWLMDIDVSTNVSIAGTTGTFIGFSSLGTKYQSISLIGMSTVEWAVTSVNSTVGNFDAGTGIRQLTAVRTT